jgi:hypothetical protein
MDLGVNQDTYTPVNLFIPGFPVIRKVITIVLGAGVIIKNTLLGKITLGAVSRAAKSGGNTGNGTLTLDSTTPKLAKAKAGVYTVRIIKAVRQLLASGTSAAKSGGNTGDGTCVMDSTNPTLTGAKAGVYKVRIIRAAIAQVGTTPVVPAQKAIAELKDPDGNVLEVFDVAATPGTTVSNLVKFVLTDGNTPFALGDGFDITVAAGSAVLSSGNLPIAELKDPDGNILQVFEVPLTPGIEIANQVKFTILEGVTPFAAGDGFDITIAAGSGQYKAYNASNLDGSQVPEIILAEDVDSTSEAVAATAYFTGHFNEAAITGLDAAAKEVLRKQSMYFSAVM